MELVQKIWALTEQHLPDPSLFVVDVSLKGSARSGQQLEILLDGDHGITIDQVIHVTRALGAELEELDLIKEAYNLEIASAGVGQPLRLHRQYAANVGRRLKVRTVEGAEKIGELLEVHPDHILLNEEVKVKGKRLPEIAPVELPFAQIASAEVQVSFK